MKVASFFISLFLRFIDGLPTLHTLIHYPFDQGSGYVIVPVDRLGLANRLRIIASAFTIASLESKHLLILWKPSKECNFQFHSIFQPLVGSSSTSIDVLSVEDDLEFDSTNLKSIFLELSTVVPHEIVIRYPNKFFFNISSSISLQRIFVLRLMTSHTLWPTSCIEYMRHKTEFYHKLHPIPSIKHQIDSITQLIEASLSDPKFTSPPVVVGVHFRAYDQRYDWPILPPDLSLNQSSIMNKSLVFEESTPLSTVTEILLSFHHSNPNIIYYFASNDFNAIQYLREFGHGASLTSFDSGLLNKNPSSPHRFASRSSDESMSQAVIDFMILGTLSDLILHSRGSSFAQEASYLSQKNFLNSYFYPIPVLDLMLRKVATPVKDVLPSDRSQNQHLGCHPTMLLTHSIELEHCGLSEYFNSMKPDTVEAENRYCFYELTGEEYDSSLADSSPLIGEDWTVTGRGSGNGNDERTGSGRIVCTYSQTLRRCSAFEKKWKISHVYCPLSTNDEDVSSGDKKDGGEEGAEEERITIYAEIKGL